MDPNEALKNIRELTQVIQSGSPTDATVLSLASELAEAVDNLDMWLTTGGYLPRSWEVEDPMQRLLARVERDG